MNDAPLDPTARGTRPMTGLAPVRNLSAEAREAVRAKLSTVTDEWCTNVCEGVKRNGRNAMNLWAKAMGLIGAEVEVNVNLACMSAFGLPERDVAQIVEAHRSSGAMTLEECATDGIALLKWVMEQDPARRAAILTALEAGDVRQIESTNGHG